LNSTTQDYITIGRNPTNQNLLLFQIFALITSKNTEEAAVAFCSRSNWLLPDNHPVEIE